jgi:hypothetical protein
MRLLTLNILTTKMMSIILLTKVNLDPSKPFTSLLWNCLLLVGTVIFEDRIECSKIELN